MQEVEICIVRQKHGLGGSGCCCDPQFILIGVVDSPPLPSSYAVQLGVGLNDWWAVHLDTYKLIEGMPELLDSLISPARIASDGEHFGLHNCSKQGTLRAGGKTVCGLDPARDGIMGTQEMNKYAGVQQHEVTRT